MKRSAVLTQITRVTDGQTDGIGVAYTRYSIYAVALKKQGMKSMHIFIKVGGEIKGRKIKLLKHVFALYSLPIIFSKIFSLATLAQLRFIFHLKMQVCNVLYQPYLYFLFFGVIIYDCQLPKFTENA